MTASEKHDFAERVGDWLQRAPRLLLPKADEPLARMQNVLQMGSGWNDNEQSAFNEGARLLTPFMGVAETWLPDMLYAKAARRSIHRIIDILTTQGELIIEKPTSKPLPTDDAVQANTASVAPAPASDQPVSSVHRKRGRPRKNPVDSTPTATVASQPADVQTVVPRPRHIDQYIHLLPEKTQKRAATYGKLMRFLGEARHNMRMLMDDPHASSVDCQRWASVATRTDENIADIRRELDQEWNKVVATGQVIIDEFGVARIVDPATGKVIDVEPKVTITEDGHEDKLEEKKTEDKPKRRHREKLTEEEKAKRITYLQKWLRDPRASVSDERRKQWEQNARELVRLGGCLTDSIRRAGEHYGAKLPKVK